MYKPTYALTPATLGVSPHRIVIQGAPGTGKTTSVLTFPNLTILDLDKKLGNHAHRTDVNVVPLYDPTFVANMAKELKWKRTEFMRNGAYAMHDAVAMYIQNEAIKFTQEQFIAIDSASMIDSALNNYFEANPLMTSKNEKDTRAMWGQRRIYWDHLCALLKRLQCGIIVTFHEAWQMDADGKVIGKLVPMVQGSFKEIVGREFTSWFRQLVVKNPKGENEYFWQFKPDALCNCNTTDPALTKRTTDRVKATYESLTPII